jgi:hypothetical protein
VYGRLEGAVAAEQERDLVHHIRPPTATHHGPLTDDLISFTCKSTVSRPRTGGVVELNGETILENERAVCTEARNNAEVTAPAAYG